MFQVAINYLVYYSLKQDISKKLWKGYKSKTTKNLMKLQMYTYGFFRVFVLGYFTYLELKGNHIKPFPMLDDLHIEKDPISLHRRIRSSSNYSSRKQFPVELDVPTTLRDEMPYLCSS